MPRQKLTVGFVNGVRAPDASGKQILYWDTEVKGFGLLVSGTTNAKSYVYQGAVAGKTRRVALGSAFVLTAEDGRRLARAKAREMLDGVDPAEAEKAKKAKQVAKAITFGQALERMIAGNVDLRPRTIEEYRGLAKRYFSDLTDKPLMDFTPDLLRERRDQVVTEVEARLAARLVKAEEEGRTRDVARLHEMAGMQKGKLSANSMLRLFRTVWHATQNLMPDLGENPANKISTKRQKSFYPEHRRQTYVREGQLAAFHGSLMEVENTGYRDVIRLMLFTGLRLTEANELRWHEVDLAERMIRLPAERVKGKRMHELPMSDYVYDLLQARHDLGLGGEFVFPSPYQSKAKKPQTDPRAALQYVRANTGIKASSHDLRRTYSVMAHQCRVSPYVLKKILNHSTLSDVTAGYVVISIEEIRDAVQLIADRLKQASGINVVPICGSVSNAPNAPMLLRLGSV